MLEDIQIPTMGMFGDLDNIVDPEQWKPMIDGIKDTRIERFDSAGHFIMLDDPENFMARLKDFLDTEPENKTER